MAQAYATYRFPSGKGGQNQQRMLCTVWYWGSDVADEVDGQPVDIEVFLVPDWGLSDLKTALTQSVKDKAVELGLTVVDTDIYLGSLEGA